MKLDYATVGNLSRFVANAENPGKLGSRCRICRRTLVPCSFGETFCTTALFVENIVRFGIFCITELSVLVTEIVGDESMFPCDDRPVHIMIIKQI